MLTGAHSAPTGKHRTMKVPYVVTYADGEKFHDRFASKANAKAAGRARRPGVEVIEVRKENRPSKTNAAYVTPAIYLNETEAAALWAEQARTGETISAIVRRLILAAGGARPV